MDRRKIAALAASAVLLIPLTAGAAHAATYSGRGSWYDPGLGGCGTTNTASQLVVAIPQQNFSSAQCGKTVQVTYGGKSVIAKVADSCPACGANDLDLSPAVFQALAPLAVGVEPITWKYM